MADDLGREPATINGGPGGAATMAPVPSNVMLSMVLPKSLLLGNDSASRQSNGPLHVTWRGELFHLAARR